MKIIGLITAWACEDWIEPAIYQGLEYCDELLVCVAPHSEVLKKYKDNTLEIAERFRPYVKVFTIGDLEDEHTFKIKPSFHSHVKAIILNEMLYRCSNFDYGNWVWTLDVDEFYPNRTFQQMLKIIKSENYDQICFQEYYFYINSKYYLKAEHNRLFRINSNSDRFIPTQKWTGSTKVYICPREYGMYHYGMFFNPDMKMDFWRTEYPGKEQDVKVQWIDNIYRNFEIDNQEYWIKQNEELTGFKSPWFASNFVPDKDGMLFKYDGEHPKFVKDLMKIKDHRIKYDFK